jgi:hypothetical protein
MHLSRPVRSVCKAVSGCGLLLLSEEERGRFLQNIFCKSKNSIKKYAQTPQNEGKERWHGRCDISNVWARSAGRSNRGRVSTGL